MRNISLIILHCSDSDKPEHDNIETLKQWHLQNGYSDIAYHFIITKDGYVHQGRPLDVAGAHCKGYNANSIGICLTGKHEFSKAQMESQKSVCLDMMKLYKLDKTDVVGHELLDKQGKTCPNYDWRTFVSTL